MRVIAVEEAVGTALCHDITRVVPGESKGPAFRKGRGPLSQEARTTNLKEQQKG